MKFTSTYKRILFIVFLISFPLLSCSEAEKLARSNEPQKVDTDRYLNNNERKKDVKEKVRVDYGECTTYGLYISRSKDKREKLRDKRQKKIRKRSKKNR